MNVHKIVAPVLILSTLFLTLSACERQGPAERTGERLDETMEDAGEQLEEAGEDLEDAARGR